MIVNEKPSFPANAALDPYLRVKLSSGKLVVAGSTDAELGTTDGPALAADKRVAVVPRAAAGVRKMVASGVISQYAEVYTAAGGKVSATAGVGSFSRGIAMESASGDGSVINVLHQEESPTAA